MKRWNLKPLAFLSCLFVFTYCSNSEQLVEDETPMAASQARMAEIEEGQTVVTEDAQVNLETGVAEEIDDEMQAELDETVRALEEDGAIEEAAEEIANNDAAANEPIPVPAPVKVEPKPKKKQQARKPKKKSFKRKVAKVDRPSAKPKPVTSPFEEAPQPTMVDETAVAKKMDVDAPELEMNSEPQAEEDRVAATPQLASGGITGLLKRFFPWFIGLLIVGVVGYVIYQKRESQPRF